MRSATTGCAAFRSVRRSWLKPWRECCEAAIGTRSGFARSGHGVRRRRRKRRRGRRRRRRRRRRRHEARRDEQLRQERHGPAASRRGVHRRDDRDQGEVGSRSHPCPQGDVRQPRYGGRPRRRVHERRPRPGPDLRADQRGRDRRVHPRHPRRPDEQSDHVRGDSGAMSEGNGGKPLVKLTAKDFKSDQEVRWCPGCGDYAILAAMQQFMPELGIPRERIVFVSGIGCAARFPYYMQTYGMHSIHGRAPAIATGLALARPDLSVWVVTGDGDALSIGGNHLIHALRRNVTVKILMFNNQIYGLTKGQASPTSELGKVTKSTPFGAQDEPFNPLALALGAEATFVARTIDRDRRHLTDVLRAAAKHDGAALVEIYQNCPVFNDGAFAALTEKDVKDENQIRLEAGKRIHFGASDERGVARAD